VRIFENCSLQRVIWVIWLLAAAAGLAAVASYERIPGRAGQTPAQWPADAGISLDATRPTLLMFAHPKCPCTRASMGELNRLLAQCDGEVATQVLFFAPDNGSSEWLRGDLWQSAKAIPGVKVEIDLAGRLAQRFGAETSGFVVLYDVHGKLLFRGGITRERAHAGDNRGVDAIVSLIAARIPSTESTSVFGCELRDSNSVPADRNAPCPK